MLMYLQVLRNTFCTSSISASYLSFCCVVNLFCSLFSLSVLCEGMAGACQSHKPLRVRPSTGTLQESGADASAEVGGEATMDS